MILFRILLPGLVTLLTQDVNAQSQPLVLFGSGGGMSLANSVYLSYSFGEPLSTYQFADNTWLTEGVQQPEKINLSTGNSEIQHPVSFRMYPNPADDIIHLEWSEEWVCKRVRMVNSLSQTKYDQVITGIHHQKISVRHFTPGVYYLRMTNDQNQEFTQAFIKI
jgi:hypothetical protein